MHKNVTILSLIKREKQKQLSLIVLKDSFVGGEFHQVGFDEVVDVAIHD
jgi:hypothetical protein